MDTQKNKASKADVQTDEFNKMPVPGEADTEFTAEEAAEVFEEQQSSAHSNKNHE